jgi:hypothetical protein
MNKRHFVGTTALAGLFPLAARAASAQSALRGPGLLTVSGAIGKVNRGPLDPALDQLFVKHSVKFDKAYVIDSRALLGLASVQIRTTLEYDAKMHSLAGPLLTDVLEVAGVASASGVVLGLRAVDGYVVPLRMADANSYRMIVATEMDGVPLSLGGLGPQWAIYDADRLDAFKNKPLRERFALCPWGLYSIEVTAN